MGTILIVEAIIMNYGYIRVSAKDQNEARHDAFCQVIFLFIDALSFGRGTDRQEERALTMPAAV